jgi:hypothetical protein
MSVEQRRLVVTGLDQAEANLAITKEFIVVQHMNYVG